MLVVPLHTTTKNPLSYLVTEVAVGTAYSVGSGAIGKQDPGHEQQA